MLRYTMKRVLTGVLSLFVLATVTFFLVRLIPGSPFQRGGVSSQVVEAVEEEYGLNEPMLDQYLTYMGSLLRGDMGISYQDPGTEVEEIIGRAWPITASLGITALAAAMILGDRKYAARRTSEGLRAFCAGKGTGKMEDNLYPRAEECISPGAQLCGTGVGFPADRELCH